MRFIRGSRVGNDDFRCSIQASVGRERVPRDLWNKPSFRRVHFRLSVAWAIIFTLDTILAAIALGIGHRLLLVMIVPGASMVLGYLLTVLYPVYDRRESAAQMTKRSLPGGDSHSDGRADGHDYARRRELNV